MDFDFSLTNKMKELQLSFNVIADKYVCYSIGFFEEQSANEEFCEHLAKKYTFLRPLKKGYFLIPKEPVADAFWCELQDSGAFWLPLLLEFAPRGNWKENWCDFHTNHHTPVDLETFKKAL